MFACRRRSETSSVGLSPSSISLICLVVLFCAASPGTASPRHTTNDADRTPTLTSFHLNLGSFRGTGKFGEAIYENDQPTVSMGIGFGLRKGLVGFHAELHYTQLTLQLIHAPILPLATDQYFESRWSSYEITTMGEMHLPLGTDNHRLILGAGVLLTISSITDSYYDVVELDPGVTAGVRMENRLYGAVHLYSAYRYVKTFDDSRYRIKYNRLDFGLAYGL